MDRDTYRKKGQLLGHFTSDGKPVSRLNVTTGSLQEREELGITESDSDSTERPPIPEQN